MKGEVGQFGLGSFVCGLRGGSGPVHPNFLTGPS
jgi:hypothetical protein